MLFKWTDQGRTKLHVLEVIVGRPQISLLAILPRLWTTHRPLSAQTFMRPKLVFSHAHYLEPSQFRGRDVSPIIGSHAVPISTPYSDQHQHTAVVEGISGASSWTPDYVKEG
jgi:hypothetical protein